MMVRTPLCCFRTGKHPADLFRNLFHMSGFKTKRGLELSCFVTTDGVFRIQGIPAEFLLIDYGIFMVG